MRTRTKLLIITTYFPPFPSVASQRIGSFVRYLSKEKFDIRVVAWSGSRGLISVAEKENLAEVKFIPNRQLLRRATFDKPSSWLWHSFKAAYNQCLLFAGINEMSGWGCATEKEIRKMAQTWKPDLVLATYPYAEALRVGINVSRDLNIPLIADLRDGITNNPSHAGPVRMRLQSLEEETVKRAARILSVSLPILDFLKEKYHLGNDRLVEIRNGFDFEQGNNGVRNNVFTITYAGTFYGGRKPGRFFDALMELHSTGKIPDFRLRFTGAVKNFSVPKELELYCEFLPRVPYPEIVEEIKAADALLLILEKSKYKGAYSAKIFDYLGAMRPIIAIVDTGDVAATLIHDCHAGFVADWEDSKEISAAILAAYAMWETRSIQGFNKQLIGAHHRKVLALQLEKCLDELSKENG
jgi:glycosyltransferase involved in cell wall biosynthesis